VPAITGELQGMVAAGAFEVGHRKRLSIGEEGQ